MTSNTQRKKNQTTISMILKICGPRKYTTNKRSLRNLFLIYSFYMLFCMEPHGKHLFWFEQLTIHWVRIRIRCILIGRIRIRSRSGPSNVRFLNYVIIVFFKHARFLNFNYVLVKARTMVQWRGSDILNAVQTTVYSPLSTRWPSHPRWRWWNPRPSRPASSGLSSFGLSCFSTFSVSPSDYSVFSVLSLSLPGSLVVFIASAICLLSPHLSHSLPVSLSVFLVLFVSLSCQSFFQSFYVSVSILLSVLKSFCIRSSLLFSGCQFVSLAVRSAAIEWLSMLFNYIELFQERELESVWCIQHCQRGQARGRAVQNTIV